MIPYFYTHNTFSVNNSAAKKAIKVFTFSIITFFVFRHSQYVPFPILENVWQKNVTQQFHLFTFDSECFGKMGLFSFVYRFVFCFFFAHNCLHSVCCRRVSECLKQGRQGRAMSFPILKPVCVCVYSAINYYAQNDSCRVE